MPKLAATLASMLLIASSIGVNIARYPQVGRTTEPARAEAAQPASSTPLAAQPPAAEAEIAEQPPSGPEVPAAATEAVRPVSGDQDEFANRSVAADRIAPAGAPVQTAVPIIDVRPMSPPTVSGVQRLPPVETNGFADADTGSDASGLAAVYPTTLTP